MSELGKPMRQSFPKTHVFCLLVTGAIFSAGFPSLILQAEPCLAAEKNKSRISEKSCCGHCCFGSGETSSCCSSGVSASTQIVRGSCHCRVDFPAPVVPPKTIATHAGEEGTFLCSFEFAFRTEGNNGAFTPKSERTRSFRIHCALYSPLLPARLYNHVWVTTLWVVCRRSCRPVCLRHWLDHP